MTELPSFQQRQFFTHYLGQTYQQPKDCKFDFGNPVNRRRKVVLGLSVYLVNLS